ncbi:MAG: hypothetical protein A2081_02785 [Elusimicrobia bacterium GWC2_61_19]|nr:MAG: hypothetical protein A2081_02785 [Elusimicrobia bacterium GWC2_61_19]
MDNILEVEGLVKKYTADSGVLGVSFSLKPGRILAYLGHNGAGKTTTVRALLGLLRMDSGRVLYAGREYDTFSQEYDGVRRDYGVAMDSPGFYQNMSALKNLELFSGFYMLTGPEFTQRAEVLLKKMGLYEVRSNPVKTYSKGMAQKLALVRALLHRPKVLFLDEPMSGLDPEARILVRELLRELAEKDNVAVLLTSHDLNEVEQIADDIVILEKGRVMLSGGLETLKASFLKAFVYLLVLPGRPSAEAVAAIAADLKADKYLFEGDALRVERADALELTDAAAACAKAGLKLAEFKRATAGLEQIYFESINRNEHKD